MSSKPRCCYSNIQRYDSDVDINPIMEPVWNVDVPYVFTRVGKVPGVINEIPEEQLRQVKYNSNRYEKLKVLSNKFEF